MIVRSGVFIKSLMNIRTKRIGQPDFRLTDFFCLETPKAITSFGVLYLFHHKGFGYATENQSELPVQ